MNTHADKTQENKSQAAANSLPKLKSDGESTFKPVDNIPEAIAQRKLQEAISNSPRVMQLRAFKAMADNYSAQQQQPIQKKKNNTGLPDNLKTGMENLSGMSLDDVNVHRNSDKPAQLHAHAYAQGTDIHLGPGQEKHLPHEAWHVVQQKQGRVQPTMQMKGMVNVNDDAGLEKEADVMGEKAFQMKISHDDMKDVGRTKQKADKNNTPLLAKSAQLQNSVINKNNSTVQLAGFTAFRGVARMVAAQVPSAVARMASAQAPNKFFKPAAAAIKQVMFGEFGSKVQSIKPEMFGGGMTKEQYLNSGKDDEATLGAEHSGTSYKLNPKYYDQSKQNIKEPWEGWEGDIYPKNKDGSEGDGGVEGTHEVITFPKGEIFDRFGAETGKFLGKNGDSFENRSIQNTKYDGKYTKYVITKPFEATKSEILPWFGFKGGGIQYKTVDSIKKLLDDGFIEPVE